MALVSSALERATNKAELIRNKWKHKRKSRMGHSELEPVIKTEVVTADDVDNVDAKLDKLEEV